MTIAATSCIEDLNDMKLRKKDLAIYGVCPARDEFYLVVCELCGMLVKPQALQQHTAVRHLHCKKKVPCAKVPCVASAVYDGRLMSDSTRSSCETLVSSDYDEVRRTDSLCHSVVSACTSVSAPCHSSVSNAVDLTTDSIVDSQTTNTSTVTVSDASMLPCHRLFDSNVVKEENTCNNASSDVSVLSAGNRTKPLLDDAVSDVKECSIAKDLHLLEIDGVNTISSLSDLKHCNRICSSRNLPEVNKTDVESGTSSVSSYDSVTQKHCVDSSSATLDLTTNCSQNGLSTVGHIVSCLKSVTAMPKSHCHNDEEYKSNGPVGVLLPAFQKQYTRSFICKSRSQLLHSRFKPFDVLRDQRERRRTARRRKVINCISAVRQDDSVSSHVQPTDRSLLPPALSSSVPSSCASSDIATPSSQLTVGCNICQNVETDVLDWKLTDKQLSLRKEITMETLTEQTASVTCDRPCEVITSFTSSSGQPHAIVVTMHDDDKTSTNHVELPLISEELLSDMSSITYHPNPLIVNGFTSWLHGEGSYVCNRASDKCRSFFSAAVDQHTSYSSNNLSAESSAIHSQDVWNSSHESSNVFLNDNTGLRLPSTHSTARSLSECCEDRCRSSAHNVSSDVDSTSVGLSSVKFMNQQLHSSTAKLAAMRSSRTLNAFTLYSSCTAAGHTETLTTPPSSSLPKIAGGNQNFCINMNIKESPPLATVCVGY